MYSNPQYFNRGFLYSKEKPAFIPTHYRQANDHLWVSNEVPVATSTNKSVCIFGLVVDVRNDKLTIAAIAENLARALNVSEEKFHIDGDFLCGRYAIIYKTNTNHTKMVTDAAGMRAVYHDAKGNTIAGHAKLLADNIERRMVERRASIYAGASTVGRTTPYPNVYLLIPNTSLEIGTGAISRFYPRKPLRPMTVSAATDLVEKWVAAAISGIGQQRPLLLSLTAGHDSRATLAVAVKTPHAISYFTYDEPKVTAGVKTDVAVAGKICRELGLNHQVVMCSEQLDKSTEDILRTNTYYTHNGRAYEALHQKFPNNHVHLRSNLIEIGRTFTQFRGIKVLNNEDWMFPFFQRQSGRSKLSNAQLGTVKKYLREYGKTTNLNKKTMYNYLPSDIYYWEQRMATWQSQVLITSDLAFDTFIPWNARCILEMMLSIPYADRTKATILHKIIDKNCPKIKSWPINKLI